MRLLLLFLIINFAFSGYAQDMEKDTILMKEVVVSNKRHKPRNISYKFRHGICTFFENLSPEYEMATMAYDMPKGKLKTLRFQFNNASRSEYKGNFKDTEIELNFYDVKPDGNPGDKIASKIFLVPGSHSGKMDIDVSDLAVINEHGIYIALHRIKKEGASGYDFEVDCSCSKNEKYKTLGFHSGKGKWYPSNGSNAFELTVTIEQQDR